MSDQIKILFHNRDAAGVNYFRTQTPAQQLERDHSDKFRVEINQDLDLTKPETIEYLKSFHIIHYHRQLAGNINDAIKLSNHLKEAGVTLIADIDDYWKLDKTHPYYRLSVDRKLHEDIIDNLKIADYVTTTTEEFATEIRKITGKDNVTVLPNSIDPTWMKQFQDNRKPDPNGKVRITYMAGSCYDDKTEILTENGWKLFSDLNYDEKVATLNSDTDELEYQKPEAYTDEYYYGDMYYGKNKNIDFAITPNHNMYISKVKSGNRKKPFNYELTEMENLDDYDLTFKKNCNWNGNDHDKYMIPKYNSKRIEYDSVIFEMTDWLKIFGYWLGDGWTTNDGSNQVGIGGRKKQSLENIRELESIFKKYDYNPTWTKDGKQLRVFNQQLWNHLNQFGKSTTKFIPNNLKELNSDLLKILLDYYLKADGTIRDNGRISCDTVSKQLADDISEIALKIGTTVTMINRGKRESVINDNINVFFDEKHKKSLKENHGLLIEDEINSLVKKERVIKGKNDAYHLNFYRNSVKSQLTPTVLRKDIVRKTYEGHIYCVTVPNHILYVRRNGKSYWCGNSHKNDVQQLKGVVNRLEADPQTKGKFKIIVAGWDTEGTTTDTKFNQDFGKALQKRNLWDRTMVKAINRCGGNIDLIPNVPADLVEEFRDKVFFSEQRPINSDESVYLDYELILTNNYGIINDEEYIKWLNKYERDIYDNETRYGRRWTQKANIYAKVLDETDISIAPLADHTFNKMKSNLKQVECWTRKIPIVCSDIPPYNVDGVHERNCMLVPAKKNADKYWFKYLKRLILDENLRKEMGQNLYDDFSEKYNLKNVTEKRAEFYETLVLEAYNVEA